MSWDPDVLFYPNDLYDSSQTATLGMVIGEEDGKLLIHQTDGFSGFKRDKKDTRELRVRWWYEFWKRKGFILSPWTHAGVLAVFFLFVY